MKHQSPVNRINTEPSDSDTSVRERIAELAEEFVDLQRRGQNPTIEDFCVRYPIFANKIKELFPGVIAMERLNHSKVHNSRSEMTRPGNPVKQLGDYRVIGEIARGGMGIVYEAEQMSLGRRVAVKILPRHVLPNDVERFNREAQTAAKLHHSNIVPIFGVGHQDETHYIVMQLIRGVGLDEVLTQMKNIVFSQVTINESSVDVSSRSSCVLKTARSLLNQHLDQDDDSPATVSIQPLDDTSSQPSEQSKAEVEEEGDLAVPSGPKRRITLLKTHLGKAYVRNVAQIGLQAANALSYAHQHETLHRDVKPANLLLDDDGVIWIADFGIAKAIEQHNVTSTGDVVGTLSYMAPERFRGKATVRSDIYSLGLTLYELLTLQRAYEATDRASLTHRVMNEEIPRPRKSNPSIPMDLETIVTKACARDPNDRYASAEEFRDDLDRFLNDVPIKARRIGYLEQCMRWCNRNRVVASLAATVMALIATIVSITSIGYVRETAQRQRSERVSELAVEALDDIYAQFAPLRIGTLISDDGTASLNTDVLAVPTQLPLSSEVATLLENLLNFYDELSQESNENWELRLKSISASRRVGDIHYRLGEFQKAVTAYKNAYRRIRNVDQGEQDSIGLRLEYARIQNGLGIVLKTRQQRKNAAKAHQRALERLDSAANLAEERFELARTLYLLHLAQRPNWWERGKKRDESDENKNRHLQKAIVILEDLSEDHPTLSDYKFLLAKCHLVLGSRHWHLSGHKNQDQQRALEILEALIEEAPHATDYQYELGDAYLSTVWPKMWSKFRKKAPKQILRFREERIRRALDVTENLDLNQPNIPKYHLLKSRLQQTLASLLRDQGKLADAADHYELAINKQSQVALHSHNPIPHEIWRFQIELDYARLERSRSNYKLAQVSLESTISELEEMLQGDELNRFLQRMADNILSKSYIALADVLRKMGESEYADDVLRRAEQSR